MPLHQFPSGHSWGLFKCREMTCGESLVNGNMRRKSTGHLFVGLREFSLGRSLNSPIVISQWFS